MTYPAAQPIQHPLWFLRKLDWILLGILAISELVNLTPYPLARKPLLNLVGLAILAGLGQISGSDRPQPTTTSHPKLSVRQLAIVGLEMLIVLGMTIGGNSRLFHLAYILLMTRNCLRFGPKGRLHITILIFGLCLCALLYRLPQLSLFPYLQDDILTLVVLTSILLSGLIMIFLLLLVNAVLAEYQGRQQLATAHDQLRSYALRIEDLATLQERNRIAREIHDSLGHSLTVLNINLEAACKLWQKDSTAAIAFLQEAKQQGTTALQGIRQSVYALRSDPLAEQSLLATIAHLLEEFHRATGLASTSQIDLPNDLPSEVKTAIYRILQEALTNIYKYAHATQVTLELKANQMLELTIADNGRGFDLTQTTIGFGLQGMRERTLALGGQLTITTQPGSGCRIQAQIPLG